MEKEIRVVHYINQFFGQIGGEEKASIPPQVKEGPIGPGMIIQEKLGKRGQVVATVICGDDYFSNYMDKAIEEILLLIRSKNPDILIAGPAFHAGRYGIACGEVCKRSSEKFGMACVTGMFKENPGVEIYRKSTYIIETAGSVIGMKDELFKMVGLAIKLFRGETIGSSSEEGYFQRGLRKNIFSEKSASERVLNMLMAKLSGDSYITEVSNPGGTPIGPAPPIEGMGNAKIALVTEGGLVPKGNPDRIEGSRCTRFARYHIWLKNDLPGKQFECIHRGFDTSLINEDPNRLLPIDVLTDMKGKGLLGEISPFFYSTCGCGTFISEAKRIGEEIAKILRSEGIQGVILPAT
jgi:glycine reductase